MVDDFPQNAMQAGLVQCGICHKLVKDIPQYRNIVQCCPRCGTRLYSRIPNTLSYTWAYLIASAILFIPANLLPIMEVKMLGKGGTDTILSGVVHLADAGMLPLAFIVFTASIIVPLTKILALFVLLTSIHFDWEISSLLRTKIYRAILFIGRWSMLDIFVITLMVALINVGQIAIVVPGPAASAFAAVVILTMLAVMSFDTRILWDREK
ncbi:MAG: paraquat-inducible protein A [Methylococcales bacterium]